MSDDVFGIVGTLQAGSFRVERVVAEGGFAVVYRAYHEGFRAPVALKCLKVPESQSDAQRAAFLEKFRAEGELLFRLSALVPTVVRPLHVDILVLGETIVPFLALEWLEGETLDQIVAGRRAAGKPPIDVRRLVPFLQPVAQALAQAHQMPGPEGPVVVVHRDVKPDNIFVVRAQDTEVVKIFDFGIARTKSATQAESDVSQSGSADAFTPGYAAPEQWSPKQYGPVGPWTDVFGLALTMVEVLAGRPPIDGDLHAMLAQTTDRARRPTPRSLGVNVPDGVERAFARALAVDPRERTRSIVTFWTELETALAIPPSIRVADKAAPRSLTGPSEAPPPVATPSRVRRPEGDLLAARGAPQSSAPAAVPFELADPGRGLAPSPASRPRAQAGSPAAAPPIRLAAPLPRERGTLAAPERDRATTNLREQLRGPIALVIVAIAISAGDLLYTRATGELFHVASIRPLWISGPLALIGVGLACWRLLGAL